MASRTNSVAMFALVLASSIALSGCGERGYMVGTWVGSAERSAGGLVRGTSYRFEFWRWSCAITETSRSSAYILYTDRPCVWEDRKDYPLTIHFGHDVLVGTLGSDSLTLKTGDGKEVAALSPTDETEPHLAITSAQTTTAVDSLSFGTAQYARDNETAFRIPETVYFFFSFHGGRTGVDRYRLSFWDGTTKILECDPVTISDTDGSAWCPWTPKAEGKFAARLTINNVVVGTYPFSVTN